MGKTIENWRNLGNKRGTYLTPYIVAPKTPFNFHATNSPSTEPLITRAYLPYKMTQVFYLRQTSRRNLSGENNGEVWTWCRKLGFADRNGTGNKENQQIMYTLTFLHYEKLDKMIALHERFTQCTCVTLVMIQRASASMYVMIKWVWIVFRRQRSSLK